jgi:C-terminal processing protease CtpA/Prc
VKSAVGGGNWEGTGVVPDVAVPAADALRVAHARALGELIARTSDAAWRERLTKELKALEDSPPRR